MIIYSEEIHQKVTKRHTRALQNEECLRSKENSESSTGHPTRGRLRPITAGAQPSGVAVVPAYKPS